MRIISDIFSAEQKKASISPRFRVALSGPASATYEQDRILSMDHSESPWSQRAEIVLNNSDLAVTSDFRGAKGIISYGFELDAGPVYSPVAPMWVTDQIQRSEQGVLVTVLVLHGLSDRMAEDFASEDYNLESGDTQTIKTLLTAIVNATLPPFQHCINHTITFDSEDALIDVFAPKEQFKIKFDAKGQGTSRLDAIRSLLDWTKNVMRPEDDEAVHFRVPVVSGGTYDEEYRVNVSGFHELLEKSTTKRLLRPNFIVMQSHPESADSFYGTAEDTTSSDVADMEVREHQHVSVVSDAQAASLAAARLEKLQLAQQQGVGLAPLNVAQEVHDFINLTDSRQGDTLAGNVFYLRREVHGGRQTGQRWHIQLSFGEGADPFPFLASAFHLSTKARLAADRRARAERTRARALEKRVEEAREIARERGIDVDAEVGIVPGEVLPGALRDFFRHGGGVLEGRGPYALNKAAPVDSLSESNVIRILRRLQIPVGNDLFGSSAGASQGAIGAATIGSLVFDATKGDYPDFVNVSGDVYAVSYQDTNQDLIVATFTIDSDGNIGAAVIDTQSIDSGGVQDSRILKVARGVFAVFYRENTGTTMDITTITINDDGTIDNSALDTLELASGLVSPNHRIDAIHISGDIYAVVYEGADNGELKTIDITSTGAIGAAAIDTLEFDVLSATNVSIAKVAGDIYVIAYKNTSSVLEVVTVDIDGTGAIENSVVDSATPGNITMADFNDLLGKILRIGGVVFAITYSDSDQDGVLITFSITDAGVISTSVIDSLEFDTSTGHRGRIFLVVPNLYIIAYAGPGGDGFAKTVRIDTNGLIGGAVLDTLEFDISIASHISGVQVLSGSGILAVAYSGASTAGTIKTMAISTLTAGFMWIEGSDLHYIDANGVERVSSFTEVDSVDEAEALAMIGL